MKAEKLLETYPELESAVVLTGASGDGYVILMSMSRIMSDGKTGVYLGLFFQNMKTGAEKFRIEEEKVTFADEATLFTELLDSMISKDYIVNDEKEVDEYKAKLLHGRLVGNIKKDMAAENAESEDPIPTEAVFEWGKKIKGARK